VSNQETEHRDVTVVTLDQAGWNRAALVILPAPPTLADVVDFLWVDERPRLSPRSHAWRIVADDAPHVIYARFVDARTGTEGHRLHVVGARPLYTDVDCTRRLVTAGVRLRPGALRALFGVGADELTNRSVPAELIVRHAARRALSRFGDEPAVNLAGHLAAFVSDLVVRGRAIDERARWLASVDPCSGRAVADVATEMGFGERALRAWSATHLGLGPRRFLSIRRLHRALESRLSDPATTWSRIAAATGFADQPHLVRDCRALLGESPSEFLSRAI
jgi:AraC-like DNA-binding protein